MNHSEIVSFLWGVADLLRDHFKRGKYQDVILPLTVLRRLDCVLEPSKQKVLERYEQLSKMDLENLDPQLRKASGFAFYNTSRFTFDRLLADAPNLAANLRHYIAGFSPNMREVVEKFDFDNTISKLEQSGLLFLVVEKFNTVDLHPDRIDNATMGTVFEELIRKFNEALNENPGEHFTPRDVVHLMADVLLTGDEQRIKTKGRVVTVYDPCCGSGGMLTITKNHIQSVNSTADVHVFGQEVNPETYAICKSDLFMKSTDGRDGENIRFGSTLRTDEHSGMTFDYLIANPPYGKDWKGDKQAVEGEAERGMAGRFGPGTPRISDGQMLFLLHLVHHMKRGDSGSRTAIIMNGSPLFTGDAGSGESEIRRYVMEEDLVEAIVALPEQLFYNTGIATYVWVLTTRKTAERKGKVLLVDATSFWTPMRKSLGDKRREIPREKAEEITRLLSAFKEGEYCRVYPTTHFGFRKITVERPLRLNFQASDDRKARIREERTFQRLAESKKKGPAAEKEILEGRLIQLQIEAALHDLPDTLFKSRKAFLKELNSAAKRHDVKLAAPIKKAILSALSEQDDTADICRDKNGDPEPDTNLRDTESVPLSEDVQEYFECEVLPHVPDAWIDESKRDTRDGDVGLVGYEINFNRYFYKYTPPRPLEEIEADIKTIEREILELLREVTG
ncbi:MAG: class I SAM-dependent DNA methyltransferase [Rhodothermales bacterium]